MGVPTTTSFDGYYRDAGLRNLRLMSRTAQGTLDTSSSPDKAEKLVDGLSPQEAADRAATNYVSALSLAYQRRHDTFGSRDNLRAFVEELARIVNQGILKDGVLIRQGADSMKWAYARVTDIPKLMNYFYSYLHTYTSYLHYEGREAKLIAARCEWAIDFRGHFFADGCGKVAKVVSSFILMRYELPLPDYTAKGIIPEEKARERYYSHMPSHRLGENVTKVLTAEDFEAFAAYYLTLF